MSKSDGGCVVCALNAQHPAKRSNAFPQVRNSAVRHIEERHSGCYPRRKVDSLLHSVGCCAIQILIARKLLHDGLIKVVLAHAVGRFDQHGFEESMVPLGNFDGKTEQQRRCE